MGSYKKIISLAILAFLLFSPPILAADECTDEQFYYILVDRFVNGNNENDDEIDINDPQAFHGGDISGITDKLDKLDELGISAINLSPIMKTNTYHGFLLEDHQTIDERFGTVADLQNLVKEAHDKDMKVVLDFVLTHVSPEHPWSTENSDWIEGEVSNHWGTNLPKLDTDNPEVQKYIIETAIHWMNIADIDGFHFYVDEATSSTFLEQLESRILQENKGAIIMMDGISTSCSINHDFQQKTVDTLKQAGESIYPILEEIASEQNDYIYFLDSPTTNRFAFEANREGYHPVTRWKLATTFMYTLPGSPMIYQGTEVPMDNGEPEPDHRVAEINKGDEELTEHLDKLRNIVSISDAIQHGKLEIVGQEGEMVVYKRSSEEETMYIAINNSVETKMLSIDNIPEDKQLRGLLEDDIIRQQKDGTHKIILDRESSNIFILENNTGVNWLFFLPMAFVLIGFVWLIVKLERHNKRAQQQQNQR